MTRLINKTWTNPQIKNYKKSRQLRQQSQQVFMSIALVGTDDDTLWNDSKKNGDVRSEC